MLKSVLHMTLPNPTTTLWEILFHVDSQLNRRNEPSLLILKGKKENEGYSKEPLHCSDNEKVWGSVAGETHSSSEGPSLSQNKMFQLKHKNPYSKDTTKPVLLQNDAGDSNLISGKLGSEVTNLR